MAFKVTIHGRGNVGGMSLVSATALTDSSTDTYPAGGFQIKAVTLGLNYIFGVFPGVVSDGKIARFDMTAPGSTVGNLKLFWPQGGSAGGTNDGTGTGSIPAGATTVTSNAAQPTVNINSAPAKEVAAGATIGTVSIPLFVVGM